MKAPNLAHVVSQRECSSFPACRDLSRAAERGILAAQVPLLPPALSWAAGEQRSKTRAKLLLLSSARELETLLVLPGIVFKREHLLAVQGLF